MGQHKGSVAWFNNIKSYGFLRADGIGDVFCHFTAIITSELYKTLREGDAVEFDVVFDDKGRRQAANVKRI